jgi:hypothetical protein
MIQGESTAKTQDLGSPRKTCCMEENPNTFLGLGSREGDETDHSLCSLKQNPKIVSGYGLSALCDRFFCGVKVR